MKRFLNEISQFLRPEEKSDSKPNSASDIAIIYDAE